MDVVVWVDASTAKASTDSTLDLEDSTMFSSPSKKYPGRWKYKCVREFFNEMTPTKSTAERNGRVDFYVLRHCSILCQTDIRLVKSKCWEENFLAKWSYGAMEIS